MQSTSVCLLSIIEYMSNRIYRINNPESERFFFVLCTIEKSMRHADNSFYTVYMILKQTGNRKK